jgi:hypothetical protein
LAAFEPHRSAAPLAAVGIACLGLVPVLGGPDHLLHWAVTGLVLVFSAWLWTRRRRDQPPAGLGRVEAPAARLAGRVTLGVCAVVAAIVAVIFGARLHSGGNVALLSWSLPAASLAWVTSLGLKAWQHREPEVAPAAPSDRPSRRPPNWDAAASAKSPQSSPPNRHVSA